MEFWEILYSSIYLIFSFDKDLLEIIILSLKTSGFATIIASFLGLITGYTLAIYNFRSKDFIIILFFQFFLQDSDEQFLKLVLL